MKMKLSCESIRKLTQEIVESSSMKNKLIYHEKLANLILGFSSLLIGKFKNRFFDSNYFLQSVGDHGLKFTKNNGIFESYYDSREKVFLIEKTKRIDSIHNFPNNSNHFLARYSKTTEENLNYFSEINRTNAIQNSNQDELVKMLLQQQPQNFKCSDSKKKLILCDNDL